MGASDCENTTDTSYKGPGPHTNRGLKREDADAGATRKSSYTLVVHEDWQLANSCALSRMLKYVTYELQIDS